MVTPKRNPDLARSYIPPLHPNHNIRNRTDPNTLLHLDVPFDLIRDLRPAARRHRSSVDGLILDLLLVLAQEPELATAIFDEN